MTSQYVLPPQRKRVHGSLAAANPRLGTHHVAVTSFFGERTLPPLISLAWMRKKGLLARNAKSAHSRSLMRFSTSNPNPAVSSAVPFKDPQTEPGTALQPRTGSTVCESTWTTSFGMRSSNPRHPSQRYTRFLLSMVGGPYECAYGAGSHGSWSIEQTVRGCHLLSGHSCIRTLAVRGRGSCCLRCGSRTRFAQSDQTEG